MADTGSPPDYAFNEAVTASELKLGAAFMDIVQGTSKWRVWLALSWQEFASTYRRSLLGVLWVMLSFGGFVAVKILIFSTLLQTGSDSRYDTYLVLGFFVWMYLAQSITASPDVFTSSKGWIRSEPLPLSLYIWKSVMREFYNLAMMSVVVVIALIYLKSPIQAGAWYSLPSIPFLLLNAFAIKLLLGVICARIQDISHMVKAIVLPMMFVTPIFWMPEQMGDLMKYLWWNPFYHYLEIFRAPLMTGEFPTESWIFALTLWAIVSVVGFIIFARFRQRIVYWF